MKLSLDSHKSFHFHCYSLVSGSYSCFSFAIVWSYRYNEIWNLWHDTWRHSTLELQAQFPGLFLNSLLSSTQPVVHQQEPSTFFSLKPQTYPLLIAFAHAAFSNFNSLFTSSTASYLLLSKAYTIMRDLFWPLGEN